MTGTWGLATQVKRSSFASYSGLLLGYEMQLEQDGDRVTDIGRKIIENGKGIASSGQTPITVTGVLNGDGSRCASWKTAHGARRRARSS